MHKNVEIKARIKDKKTIRNFLRAQGADFKGVDRQIDTYFNSPSGRLKLREGTIENHLIHYERTNQQGPKRSDVTLVSFNDKTIKELLTKMLGVQTVVDKTREIYFINNVKFHIDDVKGLGQFMEIEAIDKEMTMTQEQLHQQCQSYIEQLWIHDTDLVAVSYSDLAQSFS